MEAAAPAEGQWQLVVDAVDDQGRKSQAVQRFSVNNTLGFTGLSRRTLVLRQGGKQSIAAGVTLTRPARVVVSVETASGVRIAPIALRQVQPGRFRIEWKGTIRRSFVYSGLYRFRFRAVNELGAVELTTKPFKVVRAAPVKKKQPKPRD